MNFRIDLKELDLFLKEKFLGLDLSGLSRENLQNLFVRLQLIFEDTEQTQNPQENHQKTTENPQENHQKTTENPPENPADTWAVDVELVRKFIKKIIDLSFLTKTKDVKFNIKKFVIDFFDPENEPNTILAEFDNYCGQVKNILKNRYTPEKIDPEKYLIEYAGIVSLLKNSAWLKEISDNKVKNWHDLKNTLPLKVYNAVKDNGFEISRTVLYNLVECMDANRQHTHRQRLRKIKAIGVSFLIITSIFPHLYRGLPVSTPTPVTANISALYKNPFIEITSEISPPETPSGNPPGNPPRGFWVLLNESKKQLSKNEINKKLNIYLAKRKKQKLTESEILNIINDR